MSDPLPRRIIWFAPWTWKRRWMAALLVPSFLIAYPLSFGPLIWLNSYGYLPAWTEPVLDILFVPVRAAGDSKWDFGLIDAWICWWNHLPAP